MTDTLRNMPRYIRNTDAFGWQGADGPNGPWRSITPPESGTPWKTTNAMDDLRQAAPVPVAPYREVADLVVWLEDHSAECLELDRPEWSKFIAKAAKFLHLYLKATPVPVETANPWKDVLIDALVCAFLLNKENESDPKKALHDIISWEIELSKDPSINPPVQFAPVAVSERLPQPEDCDAEGRCWWWYPPVPEQNYGYWIYEDNAVPERSRLEWPDSWLPAHALPLPTTEAQP